jgi:hypothetical protein
VSSISLWARAIPTPSGSRTALARNKREGPLHVMAEIGDLSATLQYKPILSDSPPTSRHRTFVLNPRPGRPRDFSERFSLCGMRN